MKKKKYIYYSAGFVLTAIFMSSLYAYAPYFVVQVKNPFIMTAKDILDEEQPLPSAQENSDEFYYKGADDIIINGRLSYAKKTPADGTVILLHGIRSDKNSLADRELFFNNHGYNTISIDLRGHGKSEGEYCTYGYKEKEDIIKLIDWIIAKNLKTPIGIYGHSLGAAIAIQAMAVDKRIQFGIIESTYSDFTKITSDYSDYYTGFRFDFLNSDLLERSAEIAGFYSDKVNPVDYCSMIDQPVMITHGKKDNKINPLYAKKNFDKINSKNKKLVLIEGAHHNDIWDIGGDEYHKQILGFIKNSTTTNSL
jgi:pimeloyl-ACP methyl ester carboxylesterase